jgi:predicted nucleic acid-binding Zn ribbon protein
MSVTTTGTAGHPPVRISVTCAKCGEAIPPRSNMLLRPRLNQPAEAVCMPCMDELIEQCRPFYCLHVPWEGLRARGYRSDYQHWCCRCGRPFLGAMVRRYCSDECGERTRRERRDRRGPVPAVRQCGTCGTGFRPQRSDGRYCSPACRQRAYRSRNGDAV